MNLKTFINLHGHAKARELAAKAGTTPRYLYQLSRGERRPSYKLALRLAKASGHELGLVELLDAADLGESRKVSAA